MMAGTLRQPREAWTGEIVSARSYTHSTQRTRAQFTHTTQHSATFPSRTPPHCSPASSESISRLLDHSGHLPSANQRVDGGCARDGSSIACPLSKAPSPRGWDPAGGERGGARGRLEIRTRATPHLSYGPPRGGPRFFRAKRHGLPRALNQNGENRHEPPRSAA